MIVPTVKKHRILDQHEQVEKGVSISRVVVDRVEVTKYKHDCDESVVNDLFESVIAKRRVHRKYPEKHDEPVKAEHENDVVFKNSYVQCESEYTRCQHEQSPNHLYAHLLHSEHKNERKQISERNHQPSRSNIP